MGRIEEMAALAEKLMNTRENIRNIGIVAHIDHGKTTMTDNLVAAAGLINPELAGKAQVMDFYWMEQERGITINAANISLIHKFNGLDHLINIIDTPGHVDFGGEVIRAMRAVDGVIVVVDAVEGTMPQTETVIRQALREGVKPVLFINKVDRIVSEIRDTPEQMQEKFKKVIAQVNDLIRKNQPEDIKEDWQVSVANGSVTFGSAKRHWALNIYTMKENGMSFKDVYDLCAKDKQEEIAKKSPLHKGILEMVIKHLPSPIKSQSYRIPKIWKGDLSTEEGKSMLACSPKVDDPFVMMVTDVSVDPHAGDIATGRIYSGTIKKGSKVKLIGGQREVLISQVALMMGNERIMIDEVPAGNIAGLVGVKEVWAGETISSKDINEFESFMSNVEPVITISVEAKNPKDLPNLIQVLRKISKEDPNVRTEINSETGEHLISGMGELHLEVVQARIQIDNKVPITVGPPIVVFQETITKNSEEVEGKSPNRHNKFVFKAEPLEPEIFEKLVDAKIQAKLREKDKILFEKLEHMGFGKEQSKAIWCVWNNCVLVNRTKGIQNLNETKELIIQGFMDAVSKGPLCQEKAVGFKISLTDATLHEDAVHRGPAQVLPAVTRPIWACMMYAQPMLKEPKQLLTITVPVDYMGSALSELQSRRVQIQEIRQEGDLSIIIGKAPVKELIGFASAIRGATQGRASWTAEYLGYELLPKELQIPTVKEIRKRKGLPDELRKVEDFLD